MEDNKVQVTDEPEVTTEGAAEGIDTVVETAVDDEKEALKRSLNAERKQRKEFQRELKALRQEIEDNKVPEKSSYESLVEAGVDEDVAKAIAGQLDKKSKNSSKMQKRVEELEFQLKLSSVSKQKGYEDIEEYEDEIKEFVDKGLTIEQAYRAVNPNASNNTEREAIRKVEAKIQNNQAKKEMLSTAGKTDGKAPESKPTPKLSGEELAIAEMAGISAEEYLAAKQSESVKDYQETKKGSK